MTDCTICTLKQAQEISGKITISNWKMPGSSFPTTTKECKGGSKLKKIENSVCSKCYAARLEAYRANVEEGWLNNWKKTEKMVNQNMKLWCQGIVYQINHFLKRTDQHYHRWFDSGDLESVEWLIAIARVARLTPKVKHWLPTREAAIVSEFKRKHKIPNNLVIRVSSAMIDAKPLTRFKNTSTVHRKNNHIGYGCPAKKQGNQCLDCRACWNKKEKNISYPYH